MKLPPEFSFKAAEWPPWLSRWDRFHRQSGLNKAGEEDQIGVLIYQMGDRAEDVLKSLHLSQVDGKNYKKVYDGVDAYYVKKHNAMYERAKFNRRVQQLDDTVDDFITDMWKLSETC